MYKIINSDSIQRTADGAIIPVAAGNSDYARYLAWVAAGNSPQPADATPVPLAILTMRQARLALLQAGLLSTVDAYIAAIPSTDGETARIYWNFSTEVFRDNVLVNSILSALGKSSTDIDALFDLAKTL